MAAPTETPTKPEKKKGLAEFDDWAQALKLDKTSEAVPPTEKDKEKPPETPPASAGATPEAPAAPATSDQPPAEPEKPKKRGRRASTEEIAEAAALSASRAAAETASRIRQAPPEPKPEPQPDSEERVDIQIDEDTEITLEVLKELESINPKYKGKRNEYVRWLREVDKYQVGWEKEHPEEQFDPDAPEHDHIFQREPMPPKRDYLAAEGSYKDRLNPRRQAELDELRRENQKLTAKQVEQEIAPIVFNENRRLVGHVLGSIDPDYAKAGDTQESLVKLSEEDPGAFAILQQATSSAIPFVTETVKLFDARGTKFDNQNPVHQEILAFAMDMERLIMQKPPTKQIKDGKPYLPMAEYMGLPKERQSHYWSMYDPTELVNFRISQAIQDAQYLVKLKQNEYEAYQKRLAKKNGASHPNAQPAAATPEKKPDAAPPAPAPPGAAKSTVENSGAPPLSQAKDFRDTWLNYLKSPS